MDWKHRNSDQLGPCVLTDGRRNDVVLMHDIHDSTVCTARTLIQGLKRQGYTSLSATSTRNGRRATTTRASTAWGLLLIRSGEPRGEGAASTVPLRVCVRRPRLGRRFGANDYYNV